MYSTQNTHIALPRRYRPKRFSDVIGQDIIVGALQTALRRHHLSAGCILSGTRGVGKTTLARLIAKTLMCEHCVMQNTSTSSKGLEPCDVCASCIALQKGAHSDVIEMDAASHTSVDDVRRILEQCLYQPTMGRYKIFIIDEGHMLSKSAFNALLKTLEEPPAHVKFLFATTELEKFPPTILSRCLCFHLKPISTQTLQEALENVATKEGIMVEAEALRLLAVAAAGSMRDGLSLLDQAFLLSTYEAAEQLTNNSESNSELMQNGERSLSHVSAQMVRRMLGALVEPHEWASLLDAIQKKDIDSVIALIEDWYARGADPAYIFDAVIEYVADCIIEQKDHTASFYTNLWPVMAASRGELHESFCPHKTLKVILLRMMAQGAAL